MRTNRMWKGNKPETRLRTPQTAPSPRGLVGWYRSTSRCWAQNGRQRESQWLPRPLQHPPPRQWAASTRVGNPATSDLRPHLPEALMFPQMPRRLAAQCTATTVCKGAGDPCFTPARDLPISDAQSSNANRRARIPPHQSIGSSVASVQCV